MRLSTIALNEKETLAIITEKGLVLVEEVNEKVGGAYATELLELLRSGKLEALTTWYNETGLSAIENGEYAFVTDYVVKPLYRHPSKIWGIGLNYVEHAADLSEVAPNTEPASFMKPDTTIIGSGDTIQIPLQSERTTAEAELGVIIGKPCKDVEEADVLDYIAGYTTIIDMTAEDILEKNPRYLTRSKSFDTFFSFGPQFVTKDEVEDVMKLEVSTVINGKLHRKNTVDHMTFTPFNLVSFHSKVMSLLPGDLISTGTPGAVHIHEGDEVECQINGFASLKNKCQDLKIKTHA
ncbi:fumarylacetoacetate hydrolase family protein [Geomicrobium sediminis]|uniref:2-keto-4-pentenoate hydratase/2-oxohepta-3-ene-1,7-dioic acid hydratase in catechol pathway n=2 Tax=Geomicrobium TaxID=767528 RepID=A0ABS2PD76_9BACL|nr:fumarylacetoacetate hydrolase family protein [Geomicrobium sediminis]MBM7633010.1 2-keto-4-pentenoate hydratase/2-oxohepta-3-ene-1,7-dioic acid hydratase in catechol pathway [Geomicrobium sediminis]